MKIITLGILLLTTTVVSAAEWKIVNVSGGEAVSISTIVNTKVYTPDPAKNEYPTDYVFPTVDKMYWKKVFNDWVAMTPEEQAIINGRKQQAMLDAAVADAINDAMISAIAEAIKQNAKTPEEVQAIFKSKVDPKKADKKEKDKK